MWDRMFLFIFDYYNKQIWKQIYYKNINIETFYNNNVRDFETL